MRDDMAPGEKPAAIVPRTFAEVLVICQALATADLAPKNLRGKATDMALVIMTGAEVGLPPMASLRLYTTWDGVPRLMAEGVRAIILQSPAIEYFEMSTCDDNHATWIGKRRGRPEKSVTWTLERAKKAGLMSKDVWQKYQQDMLNARASMQLGRILAPDVVAGMVALEEARDGDLIEANAIESKPVFAAPPPAPAPMVNAVAGTTVRVDAPPVAGNDVRVGPPPGVPSTEAPPKRGPGRPPKERPADPTPPPPSAASPSATSAGKNASPSEISSAESPTPSGSEKKPDAPTEGSEPEGARPPTGTPPAPDDDWGEDPVDAGPPKKTIEDFYAWLKGCKSQKEIAKDLAAWKAWSHEQAADGDVRFAKGGANAVAMTEAYARRKAEVPA